MANGRTPLVTVQILTEDKSRLSWNRAHRTFLDIDQEQVEEKFRDVQVEHEILWS